MNPLAIYGIGAGIGALGSFLGGQSQADAIRDANERNAQLTRESWSRDDTAVQRRTADLVAAGLNPALAAGSAAATSSPIPQQAASNTGLGDALKAAGQSLAAIPTVEQNLKRNAAATLQSEAQANLTSQQARIAQMDADAIQAGNDPRDKTPINQLIKFLPRIVQNLSPGGAMREAGQRAWQGIDEAAERMAAKDVAASRAQARQVDDINRRMNAAMRAGNADEARRLNKLLDKYR